CRQVHRFGPSALYLLDHDESNLHRTLLEMHGEAMLDGDDLVIADIRDQSRIEQIFRDLRPEVVFHAAAHKHLPLLEQHPCEGVKTNVQGTANLVRCALGHGVERFILISTDKAADPTSVLGATKRLAESVVRSYASGSSGFASVRFGNVLGSRGSLLAVLAEQIASGRSVTITHPDVTRFFMTIEEAVGLVLEAARMADQGETFVLDMGSPVRVMDLVENFAKQVHAADLDVRFTGLRPGEKLHEQLFSESEVCSPTDHPRIFSARISPEDGIRDTLSALDAAASVNQVDRVRQLLSQGVSGYSPAEGAPQHLAASPYPDDY
ncbi:MAG: polysaccharide biosynthesis protein, partial [Actinomycetes bacterium]